MKSHSTTGWRHHQKPWEETDSSGGHEPQITELRSRRRETPKTCGKAEGFWAVLDVCLFPHGKAHSRTTEDSHWYTLWCISMSFYHSFVRLDLNSRMHLHSCCSGHSGEGLSETQAKPARGSSGRERVQLTCYQDPYLEVGEEKEIRGNTQIWNWRSYLRESL